MIYALWHRSVPTWPIPRERLTAATRGGFVVEHGSRVVGAVGVQPAGIAYLIVDPEMRGRGIGSDLHAAALASLEARGVGRAVLGSGGRPQVWPGIPRDLAETERFFATRGWTMGHVSGDLTQELATYSAPAGAIDRATAAGISFAVCDSGDAEALLAYEEREHPNWIPFFREHLASDPNSILTARDASGQIVAALLIEAPPRYVCFWSTLLGDDAAEIGCVGVAADRNGEGIRTALMAVATERVRDAGALTAYLSWTVRWSFYARLGYRIWREYQMADRTLVDR